MTDHQRLPCLFTRSFNCAQSRVNSFSFAVHACAFVHQISLPSTQYVNTTTHKTETTVIRKQIRFL